MCLKYNACHTFRDPEKIEDIPGRHPNRHQSDRLRQIFRLPPPRPSSLFSYRTSLKHPPLYQRFPSSNKMQVWSPRCPVGCPWGPQDHQNAAPGYPNASPGYQNDKLFNTMGNLRVGGMRRQPGKFKIRLYTIGIWP